MEMGSDMSEDEVRARVLIEKKTVLNLVDAFCVSIKHYLRGEEGMLSMRTSTTLILRSSQASAMWICITRPDISRHTLFPRVCPPTLSSQVVWVLRRPPRFGTHREPPNANMLMPLLGLRFLETVPSMTSPSPPPPLERLGQTPKRLNLLTLRSCHGNLTAMRATLQDFLWLTITNCSQHACPPATHTWTFFLSPLC